MQYIDDDAFGIMQGTADQQDIPFVGYHDGQRFVGGKQHNFFEKNKLPTRGKRKKKPREIFK